MIFDIGSKLRYQYPHTYFILCITSQQLLSCKCLIPVMFACSFFFGEVHERYHQERWTTENYIGLSWFSWPPHYVSPLNILGDVCLLGNGMAYLCMAKVCPLNWYLLLVGLAPWLGNKNDPGFSFCGHQWWFYRWTKVSLPKWYFRCRSLFGNPNIIHIKPINDTLFGPDVLKLASVTMNMTSYPSEV